MSVLLSVALNGSRSLSERPGIPRRPEELAKEAHAAVEAGAQIVHLHAYDPSGQETLAGGPCAAALQAVRAVCSDIPISLTTSAEIEPDPERRLQLIAAWTELPDLVTANQGEVGIVELCEHLMERGVGIEAGLLSLDDAYAFVRSGLAHQCVRALVEPLDSDPVDAVAHAAAIEEVLMAAGILLEQIHHGDGMANWAVCGRALARRHGIRTGLEDTTVLQDGRPAADNADFVRAAVSMMHTWEELVSE